MYYVGLTLVVVGAAMILYSVASDRKGKEE